MRALSFVTLCLVLVLSGCKQQSNSAQPGPAQSERALATSENMSITTDNGMLTLNPAFLSLCPGAPDLIATEVRWDASATGTEGAEIWLQSPGEEKKLWAATGAAGADETGAWMRAGSVVILVDGRNKQELARLAMETRTCDH